MTGTIPIVEYRIHQGYADFTGIHLHLAILVLIIVRFMIHSGILDLVQDIICSVIDIITEVLIMVMILIIMILFTRVRTIMVPIGQDTGRHIHTTHIGVAPIIIIQEFTTGIRADRMMFMLDTADLV